MDTTRTAANSRLMDKPALALYEGLSQGFSYLDCRKALWSCDGDVARAAEWLTEGNWQHAKLVSWNMPRLQESARTLAAETRVAETECLRVLKNCGGSLVVARLKLTGQPVLVS